MTRQEIISKINSFREYEDNWDSFGCSKPPEELIELGLKVADVLCQLNEPPHYVGISVGNDDIMFIWNSHDRAKEVIINCSPKIDYKDTEIGIFCRDKICRDCCLKDLLKECLLVTKELNLQWQVISGTSHGYIPPHE